MPHNFDEQNNSNEGIKDENSLEYEIHFSCIARIIPMLRDSFSIKITHCPSMALVLNSFQIFASSLFAHSSTALCLHFFIEENIEEINEIQLLNLAIHFKTLKKPILIIFESTTENKCAMYWKPKNTMQIFVLSTFSVVEDFLKNFLLNFLAKGADGKFYSNLTYKK